ncbi:unnamed protein product [Symbiodinium sp. CCMP2592]|nr:unnamed protein product [Symbiodinium sp. CCMP2592]
MIGFAIGDDVKAAQMQHYEFFDSPEACFVAAARLEARRLELKVSDALPPMPEKKPRRKTKTAEADGVSVSAASGSSSWTGSTNILKFMGCSTKFIRLTVHDPASAMTDRIISHVATDGRATGAPLFRVPVQTVLRPPPAKTMTMDFFEAKLNVHAGEYIKTEDDRGLAEGPWHFYRLVDSSLNMSMSNVLFRNTPGNTRSEKPYVCFTGFSGPALLAFLMTRGKKAESLGQKLRSRSGGRLRSPEPHNDPRVLLYEMFFKELPEQLQLTDCPLVAARQHEDYWISPGQIEMQSLRMFKAEVKLVIWHEKSMKEMLVSKLDGQISATMNRLRSLKRKKVDLIKDGARLGQTFDLRLQP